VNTTEIAELVGGFIAALLLVLLYWLVRRSNVRSTRIGVFVERERYDEPEPEEPVWPYNDPEKTITYPPPEKEGK
jgi:hypothetical protein